FFFQAEDGIRDKLVTGVQTCALPIWLIVIAKGEIKIKVAKLSRGGEVERNEPVIKALTNFVIEHRADVLSIDSFIRTHRVRENRSEERRVGKEGRSAWWWGRA